MDNQKQMLAGKQAVGDVVRAGLQSPPVYGSTGRQPQGLCVPDDQTSLTDVLASIDVAASFYRWLK